MEECARAVINAIGTLTPMQWEIVRSLALGKNQAQIARLVGVRKQAVNQAIRRLAEGAHNWVLRLIQHCQ
jgi:DNA-binding CsgD family transcriptional regulator